MMSYDEAVPEYPGAHGSGFFVSFMGALYLLTARHCMGKLGDNLADRAAHLLSPASPSLAGQKVTVDDYVRFSSIGRAVSTVDLDQFLGHEEGDLDIVALEVAPGCSPAVLEAVRARAATLPPTGEWFETSLKILSDGGSEAVFRMRGFPHAGTTTMFDYENQHIVMQGAELMGRHVGKGPYPHTRKLRAFDNSPITNPNGMSGGPVRMRVSGADQERYALVGMVLGGRFPYVFFATVEWLTAAVKVSLRTG